MIALRGVCKTFDGGASYAVRDVNLEIPARTFVAVVGNSGSGKTTLLKTINRLIEPEAGEVCIDGEPVRSVPPHELRRRLDYVFQGVGLFPHLSIAENIGVTPQLAGWPDDAIRARVEELIDLVCLPRAYPTRMRAELSGGQRQRVGIAPALAARPAIVLMDEPHELLAGHADPAVILLSSHGAHDPVLRRALEPLIDRIPIGLMRHADFMVDRRHDKRTPRQAARWLAHAAQLR